MGSFITLAQERGWTLQVIATPAALDFFDEAAVEQQTGSPVKSQYSKPGAPRSPIPDAIVVAPATFNTINKWAQGISDTYALGVLAEITGLDTPIVVLPFVNSALASRPRSAAASSLSAVKACASSRPWWIRAAPAPHRWQPYQHLSVAPGSRRGRPPGRSACHTGVSSRQALPALPPGIR